MQITFPNNFKISEIKQKIFLFLIISFIFQNCFSIALYSKDYQYRTYQKSVKDSLQSSPEKLTSIFQNNNFFKVRWIADLKYNEDIFNKEAKNIQNCISKGLVEQYLQLELFDKNLLYQCETDLENLETVSFEEVKELENKIWLKELNIGIDFKNYFYIDLNPFSPSDQFCENANFIKCKNRIRGILKNQKIEAIYLVKGMDELWLIFDSKKILQMYRSAHGYKVININGKPRWAEMNEFAKIPDDKKEKLNFKEIPELENGYFVGILTIEHEAINTKHISKVYKLNFKSNKIKPGLIFVIKNNYLSETRDKFAWSFYPILYPITLGLDLVTSPVQVLSILFLGIQNHVWLGNCLLKVSCKTPLG